jgi:hypothetical protein
MRDFMDYGLALAHMRGWAINLQQFSDSTNVHIAAWQAARWLQKWQWNYEEQVAREDESANGCEEWKWKMFLRNEENWNQRYVDADLRINRLHRSVEQVDIEAAWVVIGNIERTLRQHDLKRHRKDRSKAPSDLVIMDMLFVATPRRSIGDVAKKYGIRYDTAQDRRDRAIARIVARSPKLDPLGNRAGQPEAQKSPPNGGFSRVDTWAKKDENRIIGPLKCDSRRPYDANDPFSPGLGRAEIRRRTDVLIAEYLARGGKITICAPAVAYGAEFTNLRGLPTAVKMPPGTRWGRLGGARNADEEVSKYLAPPKQGRVQSFMDQHGYGPASDRANDGYDRLTDDLGVDTDVLGPDLGPDELDVYTASLDLNHDAPHEIETAPDGRALMPVKRQSDEVGAEDIKAAGLHVDDELPVQVDDEHCIAWLDKLQSSSTPTLPNQDRSFVAQQPSASKIRRGAPCQKQAKPVI